MEKDEAPSFKRLSGIAGWTEEPHAWRCGTISLGVNVIDALTQGIATFPDMVHDRFPVRAMAVPVAIGCVPWLDDEKVIDALLGLDQQCIVLDKGAKPDRSRRLLEEGRGLWQPLLGLEEYGAPQPAGEPPWITPKGMPGERQLDAVRVVGWRKNKKSGNLVPLLHAKLLVLAVVYDAEWDFGYFQRLEPMRVWLGSANWTSASRASLEIGTWCDDSVLAKEALRFLTSVVRISEPRGAEADEPSPELIEGRWDNEAFADWAAEYDDAEAAVEHLWGDRYEAHETFRDDEEGDHTLG